MVAPEPIANVAVNVVELVTLIELTVMPVPETSMEVWPATKLVPVSVTVGLALVAFVGIMRIQESLTDWCPSDLFLRPMGLRKKLETKQS